VVKPVLEFLELLIDRSQEAGDGGEGGVACGGGIED